MKKEACFCKNRFDFVVSLLCVRALDYTHTHCIISTAIAKIEWGNGKKNGKGKHTHTEGKKRETKKTRPGSRQRGDAHTHTHKRAPAPLSRHNTLSHIRIGAAQMSASREK